MLAVCLTVVILATGCASQSAAYKTIDDAVTGVQAAVVAYKRHCGVGPGEDGPGSCSAVEYLQAETAYTKFQGIALNAVDLAEGTGKTPLQVVTAAAANVLDLVMKWKGGK